MTEENEIIDRLEADRDEWKARAEAAECRLTEAGTSVHDTRTFPAMGAALAEARSELATLRAQLENVHSGYLAHKAAWQAADDQKFAEIEDLQAELQDADTALHQELATLRAENERLRAEAVTVHAANDDLVNRHLARESRLATAIELMEVSQASGTYWPARDAFLTNQPAAPRNELEAMVQERSVPLPRDISGDFADTIAYACQPAPADEGRCVKCWRDVCECKPAAPACGNTHRLGHCPRCVDAADQPAAPTRTEAERRVLDAMRGVPGEILELFSDCAASHCTQLSVACEAVLAWREAEK